MHYLGGLDLPYGYNNSARTKNNPAASKLNTQLNDICNVFKIWTKYGKLWRGARGAYTPSHIGFRWTAFCTFCTMHHPACICFPHTVGDFVKSVRNRTDMKVGIYHSLYEWFHPLYLKDKENKFTTQLFSLVSNVWCDFLFAYNVDDLGDKESMNNSGVNWVGNFRSRTEYPAIPSNWESAHSVPIEQL